MTRPDPAPTSIQFTIAPADAARFTRLDALLAATHASLSRTAWQRLMSEGQVTVDGHPALPRLRPTAGMNVAALLPPPRPTHTVPVARSLAILFEDHDLIAIDKPAGLVVHAGAGQTQETLAGALLHHCRDLSGIGGELRPGIVHRLDRFTSGVIIAAKHDAAHRALSAAFQRRQAHKTYIALVHGSLRMKAGTWRSRLARHPTDRKRFAAGAEQGREAITAYRELGRAGGLTAVELSPETGRTHQLRVHLAAAGHPIAGDTLYGAGNLWRSVRPAAAGHALRDGGRFFLHAARLRIPHPTTGAILDLKAAPPGEFLQLVRLCGLNEVLDHWWRNLQTS